MPLNVFGWTNEEDEKLVALVQPNTHLYLNIDQSRKNILVRDSTWQKIAEKLSKPVEECRKRWLGLRDGYMRSRRMDAQHETKGGIFEKLSFLQGVENIDVTPQGIPEVISMTLENPKMEDNELTKDEELITEQVITDNQEYYEITMLDESQEAQVKPYIKILPKESVPEPPKKIRKNAGRKKSIPLPRNIPPVKILPKPIVVNRPKLVQYVEDPKTTDQRSKVIDKLIEKMLKENTNEIDVFFRSMAASVKKLSPNLIPKVKMEVCNVIAKYEMQSFNKNTQNY